MSLYSNHYIIMDTNKILSNPIVKFLIVLGVGLTLLFSIKLLPSEAHDLKSFQIEKEELDSQSQEIHTRYQKLEEKLNAFEQLNKEVREQKDAVNPKTYSKKE